MTNHSPVERLPVVTYNSLPVITTDMLAQVYGTETVRIRQNHKRNDDRFIEGKHFFNLKGSDLKAFKDKVSQRYSVDSDRLSLSESVGKRARSLVLWTERGAARHAKMLETDQAWEVFEKLEDFYFSQKEKAEQVRKNRQCTATQLTPLRQTAERLITTGLGKIYPDIWKLVHQRFDVEHIHQLQPEQVGEAIEYLNVLEGDYLGKATAPAVHQKRYNFPAETADPHDRKFGNAWMTPRVILDERNSAPELELLDALQRDGYDITGAQIRIHAMYGIIKQFIEMQKELAEASRYMSAVNDIIKNQTVQRGSNVSFTGKGKGMAYGGHCKRALPRG